jgi:transposase
MTTTQKQEVQALKQRNAELEQALQQANRLILALNTMIEVAEQELKIPIRKKSGTKQYKSSVTTRLPR